MNIQDHEPLSIQPEATPNPSSIKYKINRTLLVSGGYDFPSADKATHAPLAEAIFKLEEAVVSGVYIGLDFVTVTIAAPLDIEVVKEKIIALLTEWLTSGKPIVTSDIEMDAFPNKVMSEIELGILGILENEIRPAVAMDGGDIVFSGYEDGVVKLQMRGACSGCPSSLVTLKMGIEGRLKQAFPEIKSVESI